MPKTDYRFLVIVSEDGLNAQIYEVGWQHVKALWTMSWESDRQ